MKYQYFIASRYRNRETVIDLAQKLRKKRKTVYCFAEEGVHNSLHNERTTQSPEEFMHTFEGIYCWENDNVVKNIFDIDMKALQSSRILILVLPAGRSSHIEAGVAYGMGKKCILIGEQKETESVYLIFSEFYSSIDEFIHSLQ